MSNKNKVSRVNFDSQLQATVAQKIFANGEVREKFKQQMRLQRIDYRPNENVVVFHGGTTNANNASQLFYQICRKIKNEFGNAENVSVQSCLTFIETPAQKELQEFAARVNFNNATPRQPEARPANDHKKAPAGSAPNQAFQAKTENQAKMLEEISARKIVFAVGPAGTGKTRVAVHAAVEALKAGRIKKIFLARPAVSAGKDLGALPGGVDDKLAPYMMPLIDELNEELGPANVKKLRTEGVIEIAPLEMMRGRTFKEAFVIVDESQNTTPEQMKMALTRLGTGSTMVVTGDPGQVDLPNYQKSGLSDAVDRLKSRKSPLIGFTYFTIADCVREDVVKDVLEAYETPTAAPKAKPKMTA